MTARVKVKGNDISLRDQAITIYGDAKFPDPKPKPSQEQGGKPGGKELVAYYEIDRAGEIDHMNTFGGDPAPERSLSQLSGAVAERIKGDGWDKIYVGAAAAEQHLALSGEENMTPAQALEHHSRLLKASFPDAPDWIIATDPETAWKADNGLQAGICAIHCKTQVCGAGAKTGCTEKVRVSNLSSCHTAAYAPCQTAIQLGHPPVVKSCGNLIGACGTAGHDKSHCFLEGPVLGDNAEDRERWHVRLPLKIKGAGYPYSKSKDRPLNLKVVLVNPKSGAAVVCSQEDRGPDSASSGNEEVPEAAVKANEFLAKDRLLGLSYEAVWKLGLNRKLDPVVLMAFVDAATPLGPVAADVVIKLKKTTSFEKAGYQLS